MKNPAPPRGRPRAFNRDAALDCAMRMFWTRGYQATSVADLAHAMGINPPSLYAAFGDKRRLFLAAVDRYQATQGCFIARALAEQPTARQAVQRLLEEAAEIYTRPGQPPGCMVVSAATNCAADADDIAADLASRRDAGRRAVRDRLAQAVRQGELPAETEVEPLANHAIAVLHGLSVAARDGLKAPALRGIIRRAMAAWPADHRGG
jgi:AcrR family transcriptional regulator